MEALQEELENYFGVLNEIRSGLETRPLPKPPELARYEMVTSLGLPLVAGGVMDQPHIWLMQYAVVKNVKELFDSIAAANARSAANASQAEAGRSI